MKLIAISFVAVCIFCCDLFAASFEQSLILENSTSPDGRYALAWGVAGKKSVNWKKLAAGNEREWEALGDFYDEVENYLVDLRKQSILQKLPSQFWAKPNGEVANHRNLEVLWSRKSDLVMVLSETKWSYESFGAYSLESGEVVASVDLGKVCEKKFLAHAAAESPAAYRRSKNDLAVAFVNLKVSAKGHYQVDAVAEVPKSVDGFSSQATMEFDLARDEGGELQVKIVGLQRGDAGGDDAEDALREADQRLNQAYGKLRATLGASARDRLKEEQIAWLKKRDAIADPAQRARFVEARAKELAAGRR